MLAPGGGYYFEWVTGRALRALYPFAAERFEKVAAPEPADLVDALDRRGLRRKDASRGRACSPR